MITGHRIHHVYEKHKDDIIAQIDCELHELMDAYGDNIKIITGMALGPDQWFAELGLKYGLPVYAYIPFVGQEKFWTRMEQARYRSTLSDMKKVIVVSNVRNSKAQLERNIEMMKAAKHCIAVYDKKRTRSGTSHVINNITKYRLSLHLIDLGEYE
ncbi:DUF1273 family protein [archaeon]|nr:DUF1273 family protein [archaeon]